MKNKKLLLLAGTLIFSAGAIVSCGGGEGGGTSTPADTSSEGTANSETSGTPAVGLAKNQLKLWFASEDIKAGFDQYVITEFKKAYPDYANYTYVVEACSEADAATTLKNDPSVSADVFHFAGDQLASLVRGEYLAQLPTAYVNSLGVDTNALTSGQIGGKQYGIPFTPNTFYLMYDASVYSDVSTLDAILSVDVTQHNYKYNLGFDIANGWYTQSLFFSNGCTIFGDDGFTASAGIAPADKGLEVAEFIWDAYNGDNKGKWQLGNTTGLCGVDNAASITGIWNAPIIKQQIESHGGTFAATKLPKISFDGTNYNDWKSVGDYKMVGVNTVSLETEAAAYMAGFLNTEAVQTKRYELRETVPTHTESLKLESLSENVAVVAQTSQLAHTFVQPSIYGDQGYWDAVGALGTDLKSAAKVEIADFYDAFIVAITKTAE